MEEVSTSEDGTKNFTWFVAKILDITGNTITINRTPFVAGSNKRIIHDNYYVFRDIYADNNGKDVLIKVPKGEYNVYAVSVINYRTDTSRLDVREELSNINPNNFPQDLFLYENKDSVYIDFNDSTINFNGEFYRGYDYRVYYGTDYNPNRYSNLSFTTQLTMFRINNSSNVTIKNINIQFNANNATKSSEVAEATSYGFVYAGVKNGKLMNATVKNSITDGMVIQRVPPIISENITLENVKMIANSRQGLSVSAVDGLTINNCEFSYTGFNGTYEGHNPKFGIDLELEATDSTISNVLIKDSLFRKNYNGDIQIFQTNSSSMEQKNIVIDNCLFYEPNVGSDGYFNGQIYVAPNNTMLKDLTIRNSTFVSETANSPKTCDNITISAIKTNPDLRVLIENNNFLGSIGIHEGANSNNIFRNNNFLMEDHSRISRSNGIDRNSLFEGSFFYITENALADPDWAAVFYASGYDIKDSYIYNEHPTTKVWFPVTTKDSGAIISLITFENVQAYGGINYSGMIGNPNPKFGEIYEITALKDKGTNEVTRTVYDALSDTEREYMENRYKGAKEAVLKVLAKYNLTYSR